MGVVLQLSDHVCGPPLDLVVQGGGESMSSAEGHAEHSTPGGVL